VTDPNAFIAQEDEDEDGARLLGRLHTALTKYVVFPARRPPTR
jgi:hypothetical protein